MKNLLLIALISTILFYNFPIIDHKVVELTYDSTKGFIWIDQEFFRLIYKSLYIIVPVLIASLLISLVIGIFYKKKQLIIKIIYLLLCFALGPGLTVNLLLKENFGRARPTQIKEAQKIYSKIFVISKECKKNCSFTSGHAAVGFYFSAFGNIQNKRRIRKYIYIISVIFGSLLGLARILQGAHFLSDIIFSALIVNIINIMMIKFMEIYYQQDFKLIN